jgi:hypothetical protein
MMDHNKYDWLCRSANIAAVKYVTREKTYKCWKESNCRVKTKDNTNVCEKAVTDARKPKIMYSNPKDDEREEGEKERKTSRITRMIFFHVPGSPRSSCPLSSSSPSPLAMSRLSMSMSSRCRSSSGRRLRLPGEPVTTE